MNVRFYLFKRIYLIFLSTFCIVAHQWLFSATQLSYLSPFNRPEKLGFLIFSASLVLMIVFLISIPLALVESLIFKLLSEPSKASDITFHYLISIIPGLSAGIFFGQANFRFIAAWICLALISQLFAGKYLFAVYREISGSFGYIAPFTSILIFAALFVNIGQILIYSHFRIFVDELHPLLRLLLYILVLSLSFRIILSISRSRSFHAFSENRIVSAVVSGFTAILFLIMAYRIFFMSSFSAVSVDTQKSLLEKPNILLISADGINADHLYTYGYERNTDPNINAFSRNAAVFRQAFANVGPTSGSLTSVLTGKRSETTGLVMRPHILHGKDSLQHLPGILKKLGYTNFQFTDRYWSDSRDMNMLGGFDYANRRVVRENHPLLKRIFYAAGVSGFLIQNAFQEHASSLTALLGYSTSARFMDLVAKKGTEPNKNNDYQNLKELTEVIEHADEPFFVQIHFLETHGPWFRVEGEKFTGGRKQTEIFETDFYDSAIHKFDRYFGLIIDSLKKHEKYADTLIVFFSDHGMKHSITDRVPLMISHPDLNVQFKTDARTELIDISPTILDLIGVNPPDWMEGTSLISESG